MTGVHLVAVRGGVLQSIHAVRKAADVCTVEIEEEFLPCRVEPLLRVLHGVGPYDGSRLAGLPGDQLLEKGVCLAAVPDGRLHAIVSGTIAHMEERGIVFDLAVITQFFIDGTRDEALRLAVIIPYQQRMGRHLRQLNVKKSDPALLPQCLAATPCLSTVHDHSRLLTAL